MTAARFRIHTVAELTSVPAVTLRAWERRYGVPRPARGPSAYRLYTPEDVELVRRMVELRERGVPVSEAARQALAGPAVSTSRANDGALALAAERIVEAARRMAPDELRQEVARAMMLADALGVFEGAFVPALRAIGVAWQEGELSVAAEHLATSVIGAASRTMLSLLVRPTGSRTALLACFADEEHSLATTGAALHLAYAGARVVDLGARTPPEAIADAVGMMKPDLVVLSVTIAPPRARAAALIDAYGRACAAVPWVVGGASAASLEKLVTRAGGRVVTSIEGLTNLVRTLYIRAGSPSLTRCPCSTSSWPLRRVPRSPTASPTRSRPPACGSSRASWGRRIAHRRSFASTRRSHALPAHRRSRRWPSPSAPRWRGRLPCSA